MSGSGEGLIGMFSRLMAGASELVKALGESVGGEELLATAGATVAYLAPSLAALVIFW